MKVDEMKVQISLWIKLKHLRRIWSQLNCYN